MSPIVETYEDLPALFAATADRLATAIQTAIATRGRALIVLTGGRNGIALLRYLGDHAQRIDWPKVQLFFGDDRFVPAGDVDRNDKQAREALLDRVEIPSANVHAMPASDAQFGDDLDAAARAYQEELVAVADPGEPTPDFDVHLLGMSPEGHVNSLFPKTPAVRETTRLVVGVDDCPKPPPRRITLTLPAIQRSREVWLVVSGSAKARAVTAALSGAAAFAIPAAGAVGREKTVWLLDDEAACGLQRGRRASPARNPADGP